MQLLQEGVVAMKIRWSLDRVNPDLKAWTCFIICLVCWLIVANIL